MARGQTDTKNELAKTEPIRVKCRQALGVHANPCSAAGPRHRPHQNKNRGGQGGAATITDTRTETPTSQEHGERRIAARVPRGEHLFRSTKSQHKREDSIQSRGLLPQTRGRDKELLKGLQVSFLWDAYGRVHLFCVDSAHISELKERSSRCLSDVGVMEAARQIRVDCVACNQYSFA